MQKTYNSTGSRGLDLSDLGNRAACFIRKNKCVCAAILSALFFLIFFSLSGFKFFYYVNDDYGIALLVSNGDTGIPFVNFFLTCFISFAQGFAREINVHVALQLAVCFVSAVSVNYVFLSKFSVKAGFIFSSAFNILYIAPSMISIQYTHSAAVSCGAGMVCLLYACLYEGRKRWRIVQKSIGIFLIIFGAWLRFAAFKAFCLIVSFFILGVILRGLMNTSEPFGKRIKLFTKKYMSIGVSLLLTVVFVLGTNCLSDVLKYSVKGYGDLEEYAYALSDVNDYDCAAYEGNENFYNSVDIYSQNDIDMLNNWYVDADFFTSEKLREIGDYSRLHAHNDLGNRTTVKSIYNSYLAAASKFAGINGAYLLPIIALLGSAVLFMLFKLRNKSCFGLLLSLVLWGIYFAAIHKFDYKNVLLLPIILISIFGSFFLNKYQSIILNALSGGVILSYIYLANSRINFRASFSVILPTFLLMVFALDFSQASGAALLKKHRKAVIGISAFLLVLLSCAAQYTVWNSEIITKKTGNNYELVEYVKDRQDQVFVNTGFYLTGNYDNPLLLPYEYPNIITYGSWHKKSQFYIRHLKDNNAEHFFKDAADSNIRFVYQSSYKKSIDMMTKYLNDHYARPDESLVMTREKVINDVEIYKVVSESE